MEPFWRGSSFLYTDRAGISERLGVISETVVVYMPSGGGGYGRVPSGKFLIQIPFNPRECPRSLRKSNLTIVDKTLHREWLTFYMIVIYFTPQRVNISQAK